MTDRLTQSSGWWVKKAGQIVLRAADRFIGRAFRDIDVGLKPIRSDRVLVNAGPLVIGTISCKTKAPMKPIVSKQASGFFRELNQLSMLADSLLPVFSIAQVIYFRDYMSNQFLFFYLIYSQN